MTGPEVAVNWDAIGAIAEIVGALAVVVTLAYLAREVRQNTSAAKAAAINASLVSVRENRRATLATAELSTIVISGNKNPLELSEIARQRYVWIMLNISDALLDIYTQTLETNFSPETWYTQGVAATLRTLGSEGGRWFWNNFASSYPGGFRQEVDRVLGAEHREQG